MAKKIYDDDGLDMRQTNWSGDESTGNLPVSGRLVENYVKEIDDKATPTDVLTKGETKMPTAGAVFDSEIGMMKGIDITDSDDGTQYVMTYQQVNQEGITEEKEVKFAKYTDDDKVVIKIDLTDTSGGALPLIQNKPLGSPFVLKYAINVATVAGQDVEGYSDLKAKIVVKRGSSVITEFKDAEYVGITAGQAYVFDATPYLKDATTYSVQVEAQAMYQGKLLMKTVSAKVTMVAMSISTAYSVGAGLADGGYKNDVRIPILVKGTSGDKNLYYRVNGGVKSTLVLSSGSGQQQNDLVIGIDSMKEGMNVVEFYAVHEDSKVMSEVYYLTLLKAGVAVTSYAGIMFVHHTDGFQADYLHPVLIAEQFTAWIFDYSGYDKNANTASIVVRDGGNIVKEDQLLRGSKGSYGRTNILTKALNLSVSCGDSSISLKVVTSLHSDIEATLSPDAICSFDAFGRSNSEAHPETWTSGDMRMNFTGMLWSVNEHGAGSGWHNDRLLIAGGAKMVLTAAGGYRPFNDAEKPEGYKIAQNGMTVEIEYSTANVTDVNAELISCLGTLSNGNRYGLVVTPEEAKFLTGVVTEAEDAGEMLRYEDAIGTKFEPNKNIRITYVFYPDVESNEQKRLIGFYVNGEESAASEWKNKVNFDIMSELTFNAVGADIFVKRVRIYNKALTSDEVLNNYIVDRNHLEDNEEEQGVRSLDEDNRILNEGDKVSLNKLMGLMKKRHNSALVLIGTGSVDSEVPSASDTLNIMDALAQLNNKKANKLCREVRYYNGENRELDFIARNCFVRIQGTSSVNYARKNIRFYFQKTADNYTATMSYGEIDGNGQQASPVTTTGKANLFRLRSNSIGAKLACAKCDYSDSSMTTNTGGAKFINDGMIEMGLYTPAQKYIADHPSCNDDVRSSIDGMPCDLFVAKNAEDDLIYYGQYNMNNEKSDSYPIFGQDKSIGGVTWGTGDTLNYLIANSEGKKEYIPICIETLNNANDLCLFHWLPSTEPNHTDFMDNNFDGGFEFNHPKDVYWVDGKGDAEEEPNLKEHLGTGDKYDKMYKAVDRMMSFIYRCVKETPAGRNLKYNPVTHTFDGVDYTDTKDGKFPAEKWVSSTFVAEASRYFDLGNLSAYYLYVQFNLAVDQLAKNMLVRTWDGVKWYITYYDGDCQLGSDNKSFLTGKYNDNRETMRNGAYVMQGHNSWLWNLLLANFRGFIEKVMTDGVDGASFRSAFSVDKAIEHFDKDQMQKWCSRLYNKSGIFKYVYPYLNPMPVGSAGDTKKYPQIYGMKGSLKAHRHYFIRRRYDLKQVEYGYMDTVGAHLYQSTSSADRGYVLQPLKVILTIPYRVQLTASNLVQSDTGVVDADTVQTLTMPRSANENDPLNIIGVAKVKSIEWHEDAFAFGFNFSLMKSLVKLDMSVSRPSGNRNGSFMSDTDGMLLLEDMNMRNNLLARNGDNGNFAKLDLSRQSRLKRLDVRGTELTQLRLATGAPIEYLALPNTIEELFLEHFPRLKEQNLILEGLDSIRGYRFAGCPGIDGIALLQRLVTAKDEGHGKLERFSVTVEFEDDGTLLQKFYNYGTYTPSGEVDNMHSGLKGTVRLTKSLSPDLMEKYSRRYNELKIVQPEFTMIEFDDSVEASNNISNLDNNTGYKFGNTYQPSYHINKILSERHRVLGKKTALGEMTICQLHDKDSRYYADNAEKLKATPAVLSGADGDVFVYEPHYWYKGINDNLNKKKYSCYSSNEQCPSSKAQYVKTKLSELTRETGFKLSCLESYSTVTAAKKADSLYSVCKMAVNPNQYKQVRFPSIMSVEHGAVLTDVSGNIIKRMRAGSESGLLDGMYVFTSIPKNAAYLYITIANDADFDYVLQTSSDKVEDIEPDWVEHKECLCGVYEATMKDDMIYSHSTGQPSSGEISLTNFRLYSSNRGPGFGVIDWEIHKDVANLFYAKYGERDSQGTTGYGSSSFTRNMGLTDEAGMTDTFADPNNKTSNTAYIWTDKSADEKKNLYSNNCMGYENWYGDKWEFMDKVDFNRKKADYKFRITRFNEAETHEDAIQGLKGNGEVWPKSIYHGRYMDIIVTLGEGSSSTGYHDAQYINGSTSRVVGRSNNHAYPSGGVAYANANSDSGYVIAHCGSRLAFRGKIKKEANVATFKKMLNLQ